MTDKSKETVGMIGLGIMGHAMSKNLIESGFTVVGYDIAKPAVTRFADMGGRVAALGRRGGGGRRTSSSRRCPRRPRSATWCAS